MNIVLLGATGFVGHHVLPALSAAGHDCLALSRYPPGCRELQLVPRVRVCRADVHDGQQLAAHFAEADAVINMVGILNESGRTGKGFHRAHVELVEKIIQACRENGVRRVVHVSALGAGEGRSHYLISKGKAEELLLSASGIDATILQPSVIFGADDAFFNQFAKLLRLAPILPLACPEARMQPVWVDDVAAAITRVVDDPESVGKTLVLVGPKSYSLRQLVEYTARAAGLKRRVVGLPDWLSRLQARIMDFIPGKPFSTDNYLSLQTDNTSAENSLIRMGIEPRSIESTVPVYLSGSPHQKRLDGFRRHIAD